MPDSEIRAGLLFQADRYEYSLVSRMTLDTNTGDGVATYSHSAQLYSLFAPNAVDLALGATLQVSAGFDGDVGSWGGYYDGPCAPSGGLSAGGDGFRSTVSATATFRNLRLYAMEGGALLRVMFDGVDVDLGAGVVSLGPSQDYQSAGTGPNYVPVFGIPPTVSGGCGAGRAHTTPWSYDPCDPDNAGGRDWSTAVSQKVSGGWRWHDALGWHDAPVSPYAGSASRTYGDLLSGSSSATYGFSYVGRETGHGHVYQTCTPPRGQGEPTTYDLGDYPIYGYDPCTGAPGPAVRDVYLTTSSSTSSGGTVTLVPNLPRSLRRFAPGYAKLIRRLWFPPTQAFTNGTTSDVVGGVTSSTSDPRTIDVHPGLGNDFLGLLRDVDAPVLDPFDHPAYAPSTTSASTGSGKTYSYYPEFPVAVVPPPGTVARECSGRFDDVSFTQDYVLPQHDDESHSTGRSATFPSSVGPSGDYQGHAEPLARYLATWPNPFWHLCSHRQDWTLQGSPAAWAPDPDDPTSVGYWGPIRTQWLKNAAIPSLPSTRSDMIGDPYYDWAYTPTFDRFTGGLPWLGISRFKVREVGFPPIVGLTGASEPMFSCPDESCTITVGASSLLVAPSGPGPCVVDIDLVRADCYPYYGLLLAKGVSFASWANVASMTASLRSSFGGSADLNDGNALAVATDYAFPRGTDAGYAITSGSDSGAGYLPDQGTDVAPGGDSAGHMANPETLAGFQGLRGLQGSVLRLTIVPSGSGNVTVRLPVFARVQGHPTVRWLDGNKAVLLWPDGPAVRWGAHLTYVPDEGLYWPWLPKGLGTPNTLADALQWIYALFEMTDPGDVAAFNAETNAWYDDLEVSLRNVGSADKFSFSLLLPKGKDETIRFAICQTVAEVPPLACFPTFARGTDDWKADGPDPATERWDQSQETRYVVSPVAPLVLKGPDGATISSAYPAPSGWAIQRYALSLTGDEADDYRLEQGGTLFARVYPWHGWDWVGLVQRTGGGVANLHTPDGRYWVADVVAGGIRVRTALNGGPVPDWRTTTVVPTGEGTANPCLTWDPNTSLGHLTWDESDGIHESYSKSMGKSWGDPALSAVIPGGRIARRRHTHPGGDAIEFAIVADGGSGAGKLVGAFRGRGDTAWSAPFDVTIHPSSSVDPGATFRLAGDASAPVADYDVFPGHTSDGRWSLTIRRVGDDEPSEWFSVERDARRFKPATS